MSSSSFLLLLKSDFVIFKIKTSRYKIEPQFYPDSTTLVKPCVCFAHCLWLRCDIAPRCGASIFGVGTTDLYPTRVPLQLAPQSGSTVGTPQWYLRRHYSWQCNEVLQLALLSGITVGTKASNIVVTSIDNIVVTAIGNTEWHCNWQY